MTNDTADVKLGFDEGETCNRQGCHGTIKIAAPENCSCHLAPPCSSCTEPRGATMTLRTHAQAARDALADDLERVVNAAGAKRVTLTMDAATALRLAKDLRLCQFFDGGETFRRVQVEGSA